jgi:hypothetical protein
LWDSLQKSILFSATLIINNRSAIMKFFFLIALTIFLPVSLQAQQSVCLSEIPPGVLLNICAHERGMTPIPQPRLYLRIYKNRRGEYETNKSWNTLVKKKFTIRDEDLRDLTSLGAAASVDKALVRYPVYNQGDDSSRELTVDIYADAAQKRIILTNFFAADRENKQHYPGSLISLMEKVEEIWMRANGIVTAPPSITFCTLMADREYLTGKRVRIYADMELGIDEGSYLHDPECDRPEVGQARTNERIGFGFDEKRLGKRASVRDILQKRGFEADIPRVRVMIEGTLRVETERTKPEFPYLFIIKRFLSVGEIVVP